MGTLELRVDAALEKSIATTPDYVISVRGNISEILCKVCGVTIRKLIPSDEYGEVLRHGSRTIVRERLVLACLPNYREVKLAFNDGSSHVTCVCADCALKLSDPGIREEVYAMDLQQWASEGDVADVLVSRNPTALGEVKATIQ